MRYEQLTEQQKAAIGRIDNLSDRQLRCRDIGHTWTLPFNRDDFNEDEKIWNRRLTCSMCGTERREIVDFTGVVLKRRYKYVRGYQLKGSGGVLNRSDFRRTLFERLWVA